MVWVHDREVGIVKMEIRPLDLEKGVQGIIQRGKYSGKFFLRGRCGFRSKKYAQINNNNINA